MKPNFSFGVRMIVLAAGLSWGGRAFADGDVVLSPVKRQESIDKAKGMLAPREVVLVQVDPFHSEASAAATVGGPSHAPGPGQPEPSSGPKSGRELLQAIAASMKPSGFFVLSGQPTLVFGQKKVKAGSFLTINFEGSEYTLEIVTVDRTNFTLRLNREEFTRPIK